MVQSFLNTLKLIEFYIGKGEKEKAEAEAKMVIRNEPEEPDGYLLLAFYYFYLQESVNANHWIDEALHKEPESEWVLLNVLYMYQDLVCDEDRRKELIELGLRLYPMNPAFHAHYAKINEAVNVEQAKASYEEAIRLNPFNERFLTNYALLLYRLGDWEEAEKYERLALEQNPEDSEGLAFYASIALERRKYKKAQWLIDEAIRIDPDNPRIRELYKEIHPTKSRLVRSKREIKQLFVKMWAYPANFLWRFFKEKVPFLWIAITVMVIEFYSLLILLRGSLLLLIIAYLLLSLASSYVTKTMLKKAGLLDIDEKAIKKNLKSTQEAALSEMKKESLHREETAATTKPESRLSSDELEAQLAQIWDVDDVASIKEEVKQEAVPSVSPPTRKVTEPLGWPKESKNWTAYMLFAGMLLSFLVRFGFNVFDDSPPPPQPVPTEVSESMRELEAQQKEKRILTTVQESTGVVDRFVESIQTNTLEDNISELVFVNYQSVIRENIDHPLFKHLENAKIDKVLPQPRGLSSASFLLTNEKEKASIIVKVAYGKITQIYADDWNESEKEQADYDVLMERMEANGKDIDEFELTDLR